MPVYFIGGEPIRANGSVYSLDAKLDAEKYSLSFLLPHWNYRVISIGFLMSSTEMTGILR